MNDRSTMLWGAVLGAAFGVAVGFLLFTERGRRLRKDVQPEVETLIREAARLGSAIGDLGRGGASAPGPGSPPSPQAWPRRA